MNEESPRPNRAEARREHLLETARKLFIEQGFHQTGVAQIASASEIRVGQIYRDFASKEDIIAAICERDVTQWLEEATLAAAVAAGDLSAVRDWVDRFLCCDEPVEECRLMSEIVAEAGRNARIAELNRRVDQRIRASLSAALTAIGAADDPENRESLVEYILALGIGIMMRRTFNPELKIEPLFRYVSGVLDQRIAAAQAGK